MAWILSSSRGSPGRESWKGGTVKSKQKKKMKTVNQCLTLAEYRETVLREPQVKVAQRARCQQAYLSRVERGHLPRPWNRDPFLNAYGICEEDFVRMVEAARIQNALRKPVTEDFPLFAQPTRQGAPLEFFSTTKQAKEA